MDGHDGGRAEQAAELYHLAYIHAGHGDDANGCRLVIHDTDGHLVRYDGRDGFRARGAGHGHHVYPYGADAGPRLKLIQRESAHSRGLYHGGVLGDGDESAAHPAHGSGSHSAALLDGVGQKRQSGCSAVRPGALKAHRFYYLGHRISRHGRRRERKVYDAERKS
jgi:hypothetical protein